MKRAPKDIVDRLQVLSELQAGDDLPKWLYEPGATTWASGMSKLLQEAIAEIRKLRTAHGSA